MKKYLLVMSMVSFVFPLLASNDWILEDLKHGMTDMGDHKEPFENERYHTLSPEERLEIQKQQTLRHEKGLEHFRMAKFIVFAQEITRPRNIAIAGATALLVFGAWHLAGLTRDIAYHYLMIPPLAQKTSIRSWSQTCKDFFVYQRGCNKK